MLQAIERYMKQAIVDKVPSVSSSALVSSLVRSDSSRGREQTRPLQGSVWRVDGLRGNPPCVVVVVVVVGSTW